MIDYREHALMLLANQLDFLNGTFSGVRLYEEFTEEEIKKAEVLLTTLQQAGWTNGKN